MGEEFKKALSELAIVIKKEQENMWRDTDKAVAIKKVKALLDIIERWQVEGGLVWRLISQNLPTGLLLRKGIIFPKR